MANNESAVTICYVGSPADLALCEGTLLLESRQLHHIIWPELTWISAVEKN